MKNIKWRFLSMYLISLLFQGIIVILLLVFIITMMTGVYFYINKSTKYSENSSKLKEKVEEQTSEEEQINEEVICDKKVENEVILVSEDILVLETDFVATNFTEVSKEIDEFEQTDDEIQEKPLEDQVHSSLESQFISNNKGELPVTKPSNRKSKKKRTQH
jgi:uncharacterized membrane protein